MIAAALTATALAACGQAFDAHPQISLRVATPGDGITVLKSSVLVSGTVSPSVASVQVLGHPVPVSGGSFSVQVPLAPGTNVVDVLAGAPHAQAAISVVRVVRELEVPVPDLIGESPTTAQSRLAAIHLTADVQKNAFPLDFLIPTPYSVCSPVRSRGNRCHRRARSP